MLVEVVVDTLDFDYNHLVAYHILDYNCWVAAHNPGYIGCRLAGHIEGMPHDILVAALGTDRTAVVGCIAHTVDIAGQAERIGLLAERYWHWV